MAPLKQLNKQATVLTNFDRGIKARPHQHHVPMKKEVLPKRKADESPLKRITVKRSALADVANNVNSKENETAELLHGKAAVKKTAVPVRENYVRETRSRSLSRTRKPLSSVNAVKPPLPPNAKSQIKTQKATEITTKSKLTTSSSEPKEQSTSKQSVVLKTTATVSVLPRPTKTQIVKTLKKPAEPVTTHKATSSTNKPRHSDGEKSDSSLYVSALEELNLDDGVKERCSKIAVKKKVKKPPPPGIEDFDKENILEPNSVAIYAMDIFEYLKSRESVFKISDYMGRQPDLNASMRSMVVNWMVEVQENFELNHETLYLGVKLFDIYLSKTRVSKTKLQLIGCASLFVAAKYDERFPPVLDDMLYVCDGLYSSSDLTSMEVELLKTVDYQLGIPLSYRFLRRYARCNKLQMPILTLARYILETSLLDYSTIRYSDSKLACAALHLALIMKGQKEWTSTLQYYSGYKVEEFQDITKLLNDILHKRQAKEHAIKMKYTHKLFFEVAKIPLVNSSEL